MGARALLPITLASVMLSGCNPIHWVGMQLYYDKAKLPQARVFKDISYDPTAVDDHKRQLDLFLPEGRRFPVVIFLHGGGWVWGDRSQKFGLADIYGNIGRFLAQHGYAGAVPSYRLIWKVDWRTQLADVARAVAWVQAHADERGGNPRAIFLMGHSAGAQLAMRIATDPQWLQTAGGDPRAICGVVAISTAGYDLEDPLTQRLDLDQTYMVKRFGGLEPRSKQRFAVAAPNWRHEASVAPSVDAGDPPHLLLVGEKDYRSVLQQNRLADERMRAVGISRGFITVPGVDHERIVLELSRGDHTAGPAILQFLSNTRCPRS